MAIQHKHCIALLAILLQLQCLPTVLAVFADMTGKEFVLALPGQVPRGYTTLHIYSNVTTHLTVESPFVGLSKTYLHNSGFMDIRLQPSLHTTGTSISYKGIKLTADNPIIVYVIDYDTPSVGGHLALPVEALSNEYMIMSYAPGTGSELVMLPVKDRTRVAVHLKTSGNVTHNGITYSNGQVIHETIDTFYTWQIQSVTDLTGTLIKADGKIAVFSGSSCAYIPETSPTCDYVIEQMPPMSTFENRYIVPVLSKAKNVIRLVARDDFTEVRLKTGHFPEVAMLNTTDIIERDLNFRRTLDPVVIEANKPILVAHFTGSDATATWGASMTIIPSTVQFKPEYVFQTSASMDNYTAVITGPTSKKSYFTLNGQVINPTAVRDNVRSYQTDYSVLYVDLPAQSRDVVFSHLTTTHKLPFGVLIYGSKQGSAFSFPLGFNMDLSIANEKIRLVDGTSPVSGRVELSYHGNWGTVCGNGFATDEANVVCRMMMYFFGAATPQVYPNAHFGTGTGPVTVDSLDCDGFEQDLSLCKSGVWEHITCSHSQDVSVDCATRVRLAGNADPREGRLEVFYNGQWGSVCDDNFGRKEAAVTCRSIGFGDEGYFYTRGGGIGPQWLDDLSCSGTEDDIAQCMTKTWGLSDCTHDEDVWVACFSPTRVRLAGGSTLAEGRVEVLADGEWLSVCDTDFDQEDANVVCDMLGYKHQKSTVTPLTGSQFGQGSGRVLIDELNCTGAETDIADCPSRPWMVNTCDHAHDAGVRCGSAIRLVNGTKSTNGRLEVYYKSHWGTVCDDSFDTHDAAVVCRQLGYPFGIGVNPIVTGSYGSGLGNIVIDELGCTGKESDVAQCSSRPWLTTNCVHGEDVGIDCSSSVRLVGGSSPTEGRVEVYYQGQWGTVCGRRFDKANAEVICRQMGYDFNTEKKVHYGAHYGQGSGPIVVDQLRCQGTEDDIQWCVSDPWMTTTCDHSMDVGIDCGIRLVDAISTSCSSGHWDISVDMMRLNRAFPGSRASDIVLGGIPCSRQVAGYTVSFHPGMHQCNTKANTLSDSFVYTNVLQYAYHDPINPLIIRNYNWTVTLTCTVSRDGHTTVQVTPENPGHGSALTTRMPSTAVQIAFYSDAHFYNELSSHPLQLSINEPVYVKVYTTSLDSSTKMVLESCYATPTNDPRDTTVAKLIENGCEKDPSAVLMTQFQHETTFTFRGFRFDDRNHGMYIHCDTRFCDVTDITLPCQQRCRP